MAKRLTTAHLLRISKGDATSLNQFRLGIHIATLSGSTIDQLIENAAKDRFQFAQKLVRIATRILDGKKPEHRVALGKTYYGMYHAARAVVYFIERGDDHEAHAELPKHLPKDFPDRDEWENKLKIARLERNRADYDPYPKSDGAFAPTAHSTTATAKQFLIAAKRYLTRKGCAV